MKTLDEKLEEYGPNNALIRYRLRDGGVYDVAVGAVPGVDDEASLRKHLAWHFPGAEFVDFRMH